MEYLGSDFGTLNGCFPVLFAACLPGLRQLSASKSFFCDDQLSVFVQKFAAYPALGRNTIGSRIRSHQTRHVVA